MTNKNMPNIDSDAFREGFRNAVEGYNKYNPYSVNTNYSGYIDCRAGLAHGNREIKMYGLECVKKYFRFKVCLSAVGKPVDEIKKIIRLFDGSIASHEFGAIGLYLDSTIETFNLGVLYFIMGRKRSYYETVECENGYKTAELAVKLHGRKIVMNQLLLGKKTDFKPKDEVKAPEESDMPFERAHKYNRFGEAIWIPEMGRSIRMG